MTDTYAIILWAVAFVFFLVCEVATGTALISVWFALGSLVSLFCSIAKVPFIVQCIVFVASSAVFLALTRRAKAQNFILTAKNLIAGI